MSNDDCNPHGIPRPKTTKADLGRKEAAPLAWSFDYALSKLLEAFPGSNVSTETPTDLLGGETL